MNSKSEVLLGSHMSIAGGVHKSIERGESLGCTAIQIFTKNNNQWTGKPLSEEEIAKYHEAGKSSGIQKVIAHTCYLINLSAPNEITHQKSLAALGDELDRAEKLHLDGLVLHPGAHLGEGQEKGIHKIAESINRVFEESSTGKTLLLLETTAGQGTGIGHRFEQLAEIIEKIENKDRLGVCLDTCHLYAAGYDISTASGYQKVFREFDKMIGLKRVKAIHLNDSRKPLGSRVDRHEHIGKGTLGLEAFRLVMNDRKFSEVPKILETKKDKEMSEDRMNLKVLRGLVE
jgi:deoxyribonuclease IV